MKRQLMKKTSLMIVLTLISSAAFAIPAIQQWQADNGATVYFVPAAELPIVDISVVFDAGAARDGDMPGLALLTNAMLPEGAGDMH